jgi:hypothetical protein
MRRITQGLVLLLVLGLSVGLMSCSGDDEDEDISGVFQGTVTEADTQRTGSIVVSLIQSGNTLNGTYTTVIGLVGDSRIGNGNLSGVINGSTVALTATSTTSGCTYVVNASIDDEDFDGAFVSTSGCLGGTFNTERN